MSLNIGPYDTQSDTIEIEGVKYRGDYFRDRKRLFAAREYFQEFLIVAGIGLVGYGTWLIYRPASFVVVGVLFLAFALLPVILARRSNPE